MVFGENVRRTRTIRKPFWPVLVYGGEPFAIRNMPEQCARKSNGRRQRRVPVVCGRAETIARGAWETVENNNVRTYGNIVTTPHNNGVYGCGTHKRMDFSEDPPSRSPQTTGGVWKVRAGESSAVHTPLLLYGPLYGCPEERRRSRKEISASTSVYTHTHINRLQRYYKVVSLCGSSCGTHTLYISYTRRNEREHNTTW